MRTALAKGDADKCDQRRATPERYAQFYTTRSMLTSRRSWYARQSTAPPYRSTISQCETHRAARLGRTQEPDNAQRSHNVATKLVGALSRPLVRRRRVSYTLGSGYIVASR